MGQIAAGPLPRAGQTIRATAAGPRSIRMELTEAPRPSPIDADAGLPAETAQWLALTGWEVDEDGRRLMQRYGLTVPRATVVIVVPVSMSQSSEHEGGPP